MGAKTCEISVNFGPLQILIANISGTRQNIQNRKDIRTNEISPAFEEKSPVNFGPLTAWNYPIKCTYLGYYISALRGCCVMKFLHALDIDQAQRGRVPPPKKKNFNSLSHQSYCCPVSRIHLCGKWHARRLYTRGMRDGRSILDSFKFGLKFSV